MNKQDISGKFPADMILDGENICNLVADSRALIDAACRGDRIVFVGRRNMGKTSLVKSIVIPRFQGLKPQALTLFVDLMGVKSLGQIDERVLKAFETMIAKAKPTTGFIHGLTKTIKNIRPQLSVDPVTGSTSFSLGLDPAKEKIEFSEIVSQMGRFHQSEGALIVIDEFQDVAGVGQATALFRNALQQLPADLPVILLGSKKHLLAEIFAMPRAPLANWGRQLEISNISSEDFLPYINARLQTSGSSIDLELTQEMLERLDHVPEAVNIVGDWWQRHRTNSGPLTQRDFYLALDGIAEERSTLYREYMIHFSEKEERFLKQLARSQPVEKPLGAAFLSGLNMSPGGVGPLIKRLENEAVIYRVREGLKVSDPLLTNWLVRGN